MQHTHRIIGLLIGLTLLAAGCSSAAISQSTPVPTLVRLPTVTPAASTAVTGPTRLPAVSQPTATQARATPTATPAISSAGAVTASMARLGLGPEQYAALGDPNAPVTIVEFSDFGCRFCRMYARMTFPQLKTEFIDSGQVYYVYKDLPVVSNQGDLAAQAAECAGAQGRYWEMHAQLFADPGEWDRNVAAARTAFARYAQTYDLDAAVFEQCLDEGLFAADIRQDFEEAQALRIFGTPAFFINGKLLSGAHPFETFAEIIAAEP